MDRICCCSYLENHVNPVCSPPRFQWRLDWRGPESGAAIDWRAFDDDWGSLVIWVVDSLQGFSWFDWPKSTYHSSSNMRKLGVLLFVSLPVFVPFFSFPIVGVPVFLRSIFSGVHVRVRAIIRRWCLRGFECVCLGHALSFGHSQNTFGQCNQNLIVNTWTETKSRIEFGSQFAILRENAFSESFHDRHW